MTETCSTSLSLKNAAHYNSHLPGVTQGAYACTKYPVLLCRLAGINGRRNRGPWYMIFDETLHQQQLAFLDVHVFGQWLCSQVAYNGSYDTRAQCLDALNVLMCEWETL